MKQPITLRTWIIAAIWAVGVATILWSGTKVDGYRLHVLQQPLPHPYPWSGVMLVIGIWLVESFTFYALLRPETYKRSWLRALGASLLSLGLFVFFGVALMHAPPYVVWHCLLLGLVSLATLGLLCVSAVNSFRARAA